MTEWIEIIFQTNERDTVSLMASKKEDVDKKMSDVVNHSWFEFQLFHEECNNFNDPNSKALIDSLETDVNEKIVHLSSQVSQQFDEIKVLLYFLNFVKTCTYNKIVIKSCYYLQKEFNSTIEDYKNNIVKNNVEKNLMIEKLRELDAIVNWMPFTVHLNDKGVKKDECEARAEVKYYNINNNDNPKILLKSNYFEIKESREKEKLSLKVFNLLESYKM